MKLSHRPFAWIALFLLCLGSWLPASDLEPDVKEAIQLFKKKDSGIQKFFGSSVGYAVFPNVGKGGLVFGGAHGNGLVYEKGKLVGHASLIQATFGFQAGGQEFAEVVFFQTEKALADFKKSRFALSAQVSAVAAAEGAAEKARYHQSVAVFIVPKGGLMFEASVGGQKFEFKSGK